MRDQAARGKSEGAKPAVAGWARQGRGEATILPVVRPRDLTAVVIALAGLAALAGAGACVPPDRLCASDDPCGSGRACVTGRCVPAKETVRLLEVDDAGAPLVKRRGVAATDVAWLTPDTREGGGTPVTVGLGGASRGVLLLRFTDVVIPSDLVEAYVVLRRAPDIDPPMGPVRLRARAVQDDWDPTTLSASRAPRIVDVATPETRVLPAAGDVIRVDVRALVAAWATRGRAQGIAVAVTEDPASPLYIALAPSREAPAPVLELYAR